ncbi:cytochrome c-550 PedF [Mameliella sediminis]|uniref:cytochrome c-550 PedF n=1 Tax=Mameliella sediminis TaxID=2836866 RepID=UPI001C4803BC|nr:cytochrome c-550 PedF [Mameliella sediminis]MBY6113911.1 cytochrome c-550 PedF [Antarctobacter heliothermus]MBY6142741.1 cytochrome c-550 PedF [Mameliella alba]MBV7395208.1 cytochrome c-550 PedF [Mameliella sediminis]MBY6159596.1 cytochrome c-550 PedF [Mameliella alba]MBY6168067.1 cytochrome c-550 PedF [Mameliella alba]
MARKTTALTVAFVMAASAALSHGDVAPQPVNTDALPDVGDEWLTENPYRDAGDDVWKAAVEIGASGYNQNCARCHGLEVISGGLAPDLRFLEAEEYGDEWYMERFISGYTQNGITKMPAFGELLGQKAAWAIRTYIEARPDDEQMAELTPELKGLRDELAAWAADPAGADADGMKAKLDEIAAGIETLSGAPVADSAAYRASALIDGSADGYRRAAEALTIGLSAAH